MRPNFTDAGIDEVSRNQSRRIADAKQSVTLEIFDNGYKRRFKEQILRF